jgi:hypothetical protein
MPIARTEERSPSSGIALFGRFSTPSGRFLDMAIDADHLSKNIIPPVSARSTSLVELLDLAAEVAADQCPPKSRPIASSA